MSVIGQSLHWLCWEHLPQNIFPKIFAEKFEKRERDASIHLFDFSFTGRPGGKTHAWLGEKHSFSYGPKVYKFKQQRGT